MFNSVECQSCGDSVWVGRAEQPLSYVTREATNRDPRTFLIMGHDNGRDRLLHRCSMAAPAT